MTIDETTSVIIDEIIYFLKSYRELGSDEYKYFEEIRKMITGKITLTIDFVDLPDKLALYLRNNPDVMLPAFNDALKSILHEVHPEYEEVYRDKLRVAFIGIEPEPTYRLDVEHVNKFIAIAGKVQGIEEPQPIVSKWVGRCTNCNTTTEGKEGKKPKKCGACDEKELEFDAENSKMENVRFITILMSNNQNGGSSIAEEDNKSTVAYVELHGELIDSDIYFGDDIIVTGTVRLDGSFGRPPRVGITSMMLYIEANNVTQLKKKEDKITLTEEDKKFFQKWVEEQGDNLIATLVKSHTPRIHGNEYVKEGMIYQLTGSEIKDTEEKEDINILLIGDAGTAKTEILRSQARYAGGVYQSSEGVSAAGIAAGLVKDEKTGRYLYQAGFAVMSDRKLKALDEIDKLKPEHRNQLYTIMESGKYFLGRVVKKELDARGPWLIAGNPLYGRYDIYKNLIDNINLPAPFLSRFDLIFIFRDASEKEKDDAVLRRIFQRYQGIANLEKSTNENILTEEQLVKFIQHARTIQPVLTEQAFAVLQETFHQLRQKDDILITYRQFQGLIRLAIARAKLHLRDSVTEEDSRRAVFLLWSSLKSAGIDVNTGKIDLGILYGKPQSEVSRLKLFDQIFDSLAKDRDGIVQLGVLQTELEKTGKFTEDQIRNIVRQQEREGRIFQRMKDVYARS